MWHADHLACGYARDVFGKAVNELKAGEQNHVAMPTKRHPAS